MNWIKIEDIEPFVDQLVLVKGYYHNAFHETDSEIELGLVEYYEPNYSSCKDNSETYYSNITEWCEVTE